MKIIGYYVPYNDPSIALIDVDIYAHFSCSAAGVPDYTSSNLSSWDVAANALHAQGKKFLLSIYTDTTKNGMVTVLASPSLRTTLINNLVSMLNSHPYDGISIDYEVTVDLFSFTANMSAFINELYSKMPAGKNEIGYFAEWYAGYSNHGWSFDTIAAQKIKYIQIGFYDMWGVPKSANMPFTQDYNFGVTEIQTWIGAGYPKQNMYWGLPAYGEKLDAVTHDYISGVRQHILYKDILTQFNPSASQNAVTSGGYYWEWTGHDLAAREMQFCIDNGLAGVMVFTPTQDNINDPRSIMHAIQISAPVAIQDVAWTVGWASAQYNDFPWTHFSKVIWQHIVSLSNAGIGTFEDNTLAQLDSLVAIAHGHGVKALVSVWADGNFDTVVNNSSLRATFISNLNSFITAHNCDGIAFDIETGGVSASTLAVFINQLRTAIGINKFITVIGICVGPGFQNGGIAPNIDISAQSAIDFISLMTYDFWVDPSCGTVASITNTVNAWVNAGWNKSKLFVGIPFFARNTFSWDVYVAWNEFYNSYHPLPTQHNMTIGGLSVWWNNAQDIIDKVNYVKSQNLGGVWGYMINNDAINSDHSMETSMFNAIGGVSPPPTATVLFTSSPSGAEVWLDGVYIGDPNNVQTGYTPQTREISTGRHHIGFWLYGYNNGNRVEADIDITGDMTINGDMVNAVVTVPGNFSPNSNKVATVSVTVIPVGIGCTIEVFLSHDGTTRNATSGNVNFNSTGVAQNIALPITMPAAIGTYHVYTVVKYLGIVLSSVVAATDVTVA